MAKKSTTPKETSKGLFDHVNAIYAVQTTEYFDSLTDKERKAYSQYMVNRFLSMNPLQSVLVNEIQSYGKIPDKAHYLFFTKLLPKKRQFNKYIKKDKGGDIPEWLVPLLTNHYKTSVREVMDYLDIFMMNDENVSNLKEICKLYGITDKQLKEIDKYVNQR